MGGRTCNHIAFAQADLSWQIWIEDGDKPLPRRLVVSYDNAPGRPQYTLLITQWETPSLMPDSEFNARLPDGAASTSLLTLTGQPATGS